MKLTLYRKMVIGFGVMILAMVLVNGYILFQLNSFSKTVKTILTSDIQSIDAAKQLHTQLNDEERSAQKFLISRDTTYALLFQETSRHFSEQTNSLLGSLTTRGERNLMEQVQRQHALFAASILSLRPGVSEGSLTEQAVADTMEILRARLDDFINISKSAISASMAGLESTTSSVLHLALVLTLCAFVGTIVVSFFITRSITRPIRILRAGTEKIARGIFAPIRVASGDEIAVLADAFNDMSNKLKKLNDLKADMMQQISHELRMPLQSMLSAYYLLTEQIPGPVNDAQRKLLDAIRRNVDRIVDFSNQFLDLSKIEAGMMKFQMAENDMAAIVTQAVENARVAAEGKGIAITLQTLPAPLVFVDPEKVTQVANNYISNAIKYTGAGGTIAVEVCPSDFGVRLAVTDSGVGIHPADIPQLFAKFYQARNVAKASTRGTGLGLALVKAIVEGHGGKIRATSTLGVGSTFAAEFPRAGKRRPAATAIHATTGGKVAHGK